MAGSKKAPHFTPDLFRFLRDLDRNNRREWFEKHKERYLDRVRDPLLQFIADLGPRLHKISNRLVADPRPMGGSMFRIYRDTRFSKDKRPYKTAATARFQHHRGKDVHTSGYYLHLGTDGVFFGAGIWRPDPAQTLKIRSAIVEDPGGWKRVTRTKAFRDGGWALDGDSLKRVPRGFDPEHPLAEDLKRKDFTAFLELDEKAACAPDFLDRYVKGCRDVAPFVKFLTEAVGETW